ncbi:MAG: SCO family protein [Candidatus Puniceispirillaceae bacterium]|jgi:protein SCO1/2
MGHAVRKSGRRGIAVAAVIGFCLLAAAVFWLAERQARQMDVGFRNFQDQPFELVDQTGTPRRNADFAGAPIALFFGYSYCPDVCPMTLTLLATSLDAVAAQGGDPESLQTIFMTVDAERDTPEQLAAYLSLFDLPVTGLTGKASQLASAHEAFGAYAKRVEVEDGVVLFDHTATVYLYDETGAFTGTITFNEPPEFAVEKLARLL